MDIITLSLVVLTVSLVIAGTFMARSKTGLGIFLGVLPIPLMVVTNIAGVALLVLYIIGVMIIAVVQSRKNNARIPCLSA